ncbi:6407_t:CDS:2 [Paraglomus occultum]|uniref:6407_t:CDS:1 n=1 Tax=Paraglomus occultum TaxID=144539 RepID=A0A9N8Z216_9GLOM|nr:6407_t:CDS:2 [Paraglomus occultum]
MDPAVDAWKEGLAHLLGPITTSVILLMNILNALLILTTHMLMTGLTLVALTKLCSTSLSKSIPQKSRAKAFRHFENADRTFERNEVTLFFEELDTRIDTTATNNLANAKGDLLESKLRVHALNNIINLESNGDPIPNRESEEVNSSQTPPLRSPLNDYSPLESRNRRQMSDEKVIHVILSRDRDLATDLQKSGDEFKMEIMRKIEGDEGNDFRLTAKKFNGLNLSRKIGERKYIVQNVSSLFKFYESTFGNLYFDWIETHSPAPKLTKSRTYTGIVKVDAKVFEFYDDKEIFHAEVSGPPSSSSSQHGHAVNDTTKSIHAGILNLIAILLDHHRAPIEYAINIKILRLTICILFNY